MRGRERKTENTKQMSLRKELLNMVESIVKDAQNTGERQSSQRDHLKKELDQVRLKYSKIKD